MVFVKSKNLCLKSGVLKPEPIEPKICKLSNNENPNLNLLDKTGE